MTHREKVTTQLHLKKEKLYTGECRLNKPDKIGFNALNRMKEDFGNMKKEQ